jgi:hypothetical protein
MLREMIADAGPAAIAIGSMFLFILVFIGVALRVWTLSPEEGALRARLPLDDEPETIAIQDAAGGSHGQA